MKKIIIGDIPLMAITENDIRQIVIIEGCSPSPLFWNDPKVIRYDNTMFSDTIVLDYTATRKADGLISGDYTFFLCADTFRFHYSRDYVNDILKRSVEGQRLGIESLSFLIKQGYSIPI